MELERQGDQMSALPWNDGGQDCMIFGLPQPETDDGLNCVGKSRKHSLLTPVTQWGEKGFVEYYGEKFCWETGDDQLSATCWGPQVEGMAEQDNFNYEWELKKIGGYYYNRVGWPMQKADAYLPSKTPADCISFCFETTGQPVFAVTFKGSFFITRKVFGVITTFGPWPGISAQMWNNGLAYSYLYDAGVEDAVCYYLKPGQNKLYARFLRDNFGVEYTIITGLPAKLKNLFISDFVLYRLYINAVEGQKGIVIKSDLYPPPLINDHDSLAIVADFVDGNYTLIAVLIATQKDSARITPSFTDGNYMPLSVAFATQQDSLAVAMSYADGNYNEIVIVFGSAWADKLGLLAGYTDGNYNEIVKTIGTYNEKIGLTVGFTDGNYYP